MHPWLIRLSRQCVQLFSLAENIRIVVHFLWGDSQWIEQIMDEPISTNSFIKKSHYDEKTINAHQHQFSDYAASLWNTHEDFLTHNITCSVRSHILTDWTKTHLKKRKTEDPKILILLSENTGRIQYLKVCLESLTHTQ